MTFITSNYQTQCAKAFGTSLQLGMQEDTHVCVSEPHKKQKKTLLIRNRPSNDPSIEMGVAHAFKRCIFEHPSSVLNTFMFMQNQDLKCNCAIL